MFRKPRNDLIRFLQDPKAVFDETHTPLLISFLQRTGLGFTGQLQDKLADNGPEANDLNVGPIGALSLDNNV